tara:strand:+ start:76 stop:831 length:756 start_codon:yes stop_codon:yes gene_type:complete
MSDKNSEEENKGKEEAPEVIERLAHPKIWTFAVVTVFSLILSVGALTEISSRQSSLAEAEASMNVLQERITASVFLSLDADNSVMVGEKSNDEQEVINPDKIRNTYLGLSKDIAAIKNEISNGKDYSNYKFRNEVDYLIRVSSLKSLSTETLLGLLLITCGILGSVMSTMRDGKGSAAKSIVLGASVGFVALLGVKSGSTLFILTNAGVDVPYNAYSTAFAGVVAGMFSEKLYLALSRLTDKAFGDENANK